jgi:hypothetical protein
MNLGWMSGWTTVHPFSFYMMNKAAKTVTDAIVGNDFQTVVINNQPYTIYPPTIHKMSGAISCLSSIDIDECKSFKEVFAFCKDIEELAKALSWMIDDSESLTEELSKGTVEEVVDALYTSFSLISTEVFQHAVSLMKNVSRLAAKEKS